MPRCRKSAKRMTDVRARMRSATRPSGTRSSISSCLPKARRERNDSTIVIAQPRVSAVRKKKSGRSGEYQSGWSFVGTIR